MGDTRHAMLVAVSVLAVGCSAVEAPLLPPSAALPTVGPPPAGAAEACPAALLAGARLHGDQSQTPPVWVVTPDGKPVSVVWHRRFSARFAPQVELLEEGRVVAREGDLLDLGGGSADHLGFDFFACTLDRVRR